MSWTKTKRSSVYWFGDPPDTFGKMFNKHFVKHLIDTTAVDLVEYDGVWMAEQSLIEILETDIASNWQKVNSWFTKKLTV